MGIARSSGRRGKTWSELQSGADTRDDRKNTAEWWIENSVRTIDTDGVRPESGRKGKERSPAKRQHTSEGQGRPMLSINRHATHRDVMRQVTTADMKHEPCKAR